MVLKLTVYVRNVISFFISQNLGEIPIFGTFLAKISILDYVLLKIDYFEVRTFYGVYVGCLYLLLILVCMEKKRPTHRYQLDISGEGGVQFSSFQVV